MFAHVRQHDIQFTKPFKLAQAAPDSNRFVISIKQNASCNMHAVPCVQHCLQSIALQTCNIPTIEILRAILTILTQPAWLCQAVTAAAAAC